MRNCPFCQVPSPLRMRTRDFNRKTTRQIFRYYRCPRCELWFLSPIPRKMGRYYPDEYYAFPGVDALRTSATTHESYKLDAITPVVQGGKMLEIGPGNGGFALLAKEAGFEVHAIEMDARSCAFLREKIGVGARQSDDPTSVLRESDETFDVIVMWHVIEHLPDGWELLRQAALHLNPGGIIALAAPNPDSLGFRVLRWRWPHVDAPRHLRLLPISFLEQRAHELELEMVSLTTSDFGSIECNHMAWRAGLMSLTKYCRPRVVLYRIANAIIQLLQRFEQEKLRGSAYTLVLRKR